MFLGFVATASGAVVGILVIGAGLIVDRVVVTWMLLTLR